MQKCDDGKGSVPNTYLPGSSLLISMFITVYFFSLFAHLHKFSGFNVADLKGETVIDNGQATEKVTKNKLLNKCEHFRSLLVHYSSLITISVHYCGQQL